MSHFLALKLIPSYKKSEMIERPRLGSRSSLDPIAKNPLFGAQTFPKSPLLKVLLAVLLLSGRPCTAATSVYLTFEGSEPGVAELVTEGDKLQPVKRLPTGPLLDPFKIVANANGDQIAVAVGGKQDPAVLLLEPAGSGTVKVPLDAEVSDLGFDGSALIVATSKGLFYKFGPKGEPLAKLDARKALQPPGRKGEFIAILEPGKALISFQKDDDNTDAKGNRLVLLDTAAFKLIADMPLERDHPDLHLADDPTEQGPGPEVILPFPSSDTLAVSLDLYGALLFANLKAARMGRLKGVSLLSTHPDGTFGRAFPDRMLAVQHGGRDLLLCANAAPRDAGGGLVLVDVAKRAILKSFPTPAGAEMPVRVGNRLVTVISGKTKRIHDGRLKRRIIPSREMHVIELPKGDRPVEPPADDVAHAVHSLPLDPVNIIPAEADSVIVTGVDETTAAALLIDPASGTILDRTDLPGPPVRAINPGR